ncbi:hypothetical protein BH18ACT10_BH18ACT10_19080 [soil metagenome]
MCANRERLEKGWWEEHEKDDLVVGLDGPGDAARERGGVGGHTVKGTEGPDTLQGTPSRDVIIPFCCDDTVYA